MIKSKYFGLGVLLLSIFFLVGGAVDIDWMVTSYYYRFGNGLGGDWYFTPYWCLNWWDAYFVSILRIVLGAGGIGSFVGDYVGQKDLCC